MTTPSVSDERLQDMIAEDCGCDNCRALRELQTARSRIAELEKDARYDRDLYGRALPLIPKRVFGDNYQIREAIRKRMQALDAARKEGT